MKALKVLHVVKDSKFFEEIYGCFESSSFFENSYILEVNKKNYVIKNSFLIGKVQILWKKKMIISRLRENNYDIVLFHSMQPLFYKYFDYIDYNKKIIWWSWGYDLYGRVYGLRPFINLEMFKPRSLKLYNHLFDHYLDYLKLFIKWNVISKRRKLLKRIDYFIPVIHIEYSMMNKLSGFRAKEFYYPNFLNFKLGVNNGKSILVGNSATYENNHLDVWHSIKDYLPEGRDVIFPLSYGDKNYASLLSSKIKSDKVMLRFVIDFLPIEHYYELLSNCTYAVYGVMRQMAMGNIYYCLTRGMKLFLYKDSIVYKHLIEVGYIVFQIEEITSDSFEIPLSELERRHNYEMYNKEVLLTQKICDDVVCELLNSTPF